MKSGHSRRTCHIILINGDGRGFGGAGVSPAILRVDGDKRTHRRDAGATKPRSLRKIRIGAESRVRLLRKIQVNAAKENHLDRLVFRVA